MTPSSATESPDATDEPTLDATDTPDASLTLDENDESLDESGITPFVVGTPDGGTAPYVYWTVTDVDTGELVPGATFKFERRNDSQWSAHSSADPFSDCAAASCSALDRDTDGGEFLLTHYRTSLTDPRKLVNGSNYRVGQVTAPAGYQWVVSGSNTKTIGTNNSNNANWNNQGGSQTQQLRHLRGEAAFGQHHRQEGRLANRVWCRGLGKSGRTEHPGRTLRPVLVSDRHDPDHRLHEPPDQPQLLRDHLRTAQTACSRTFRWATIGLGRSPPMPEALPHRATSRP